MSEFPLKWGAKSPEKKEGTDPIILATWGCHTAGGCQIKLWGRTSKAGKGRLFLFLVN